MIVGALEKKNRFRCAGLLAVFLVTIFFVGCIAAIPIAVYYFQTDDNYVAEADARKNADEVWSVIVRLGKQAEADGRLEIVELDDKNRLLKATDGVQTAEVKVIALKEREKSRVTVIATVPKGGEKKREKAEELAARIMKRLCEEADAKCELVEG